jgi:hypothetical protein
MSDSQRGAENPDSGPDSGPDRGPNLTLIYSLIGLALILAIGFAALVVLPFYLRR